MGSLKKGVNEDNSYEDDNIEVVDENYNFQGVNQAALARHLLSPPSPSGQQVHSSNLDHHECFLANQKQNFLLSSSSNRVKTLTTTFDQISSR